MNKLPYMYTQNQQEAVQSFIAENFGQCEDCIMHEKSSEYVHTDTAVVSSEDGSKTFVTFGMGAREMTPPPLNDFKRTELTMSVTKSFDPMSKKGMVIGGELCRISKFPFKNNTWLGPGHTIDASEQFEQDFGYQYFAFWGLDLCADATDGIDKVNFLALVPLYEAEREWIVANNTDYYLTLLYERYGDDIFNVDIKREQFVPDKELDEDDMDAIFLMRALGIDRETLLQLNDYLEIVVDNGGEITHELISNWLEKYK